MSELTRRATLFGLAALASLRSAPFALSADAAAARLVE